MMDPGDGYIEEPVHQVRMSALYLLQIQEPPLDLPALVITQFASERPHFLTYSEVPGLCHNRYDTMTSEKVHVTWRGTF